jgi:hypothetical protein
MAHEFIEFKLCILIYEAVPTLSVIAIDVQL